ncbi:transcription termination/antitermination NusG family protein [Pseudomonas sp. AA4]|uniref:transcription termination/antitermination NusG family protein n=1 Tax=unclassified Pseudomonas TaxID=196821 RepID=UPI002B2376D6|nr:MULTISPECIES: transcription termination/antitermination NusG family protein [unclassified Pseudomonas]MEA9996507.1 transcription termination/antitermination NusG family protein [Pseudomonas sp. AA4]MEB0222176.1 transcription termination/antitermination NusG family protein [Pseudomonas sp. AB12(2023)]
MFRWHLITHNFHAFQMVTEKIKLLGVEVFAPTKIEVKKRRDCNAVRYMETQLFPGYLFVRLDPEQVHPSKISDIPGVKEFVRFGGEICSVSNSLIEALRESLLLQVDQKVTSLECRNVSSDVLRTLSVIALMKSKLERQTALFALLQNDSQLIHMGSQPYSRIGSVIEKPQVNELLW